MPRLNHEFVTNTNTPGEYRDDKLKGFRLRIWGNGIKKYEVHGRIKGGTIVTVPIGRHGQPWTAKSAREAAEEKLHLMKTGVDPRVETKKQQAEQEAWIAADQKEAALKTLTLKTVYEAWAASERTVKQSTKNLYKQVIFKHLHGWLHKPITSITQDMVIKRYNEIADQTIGSAGNTFRALRRLFSWAIAEYEDEHGVSFISVNPVTVLSKRKKWQKLKPRMDYVADEDLKPWFESVYTLPYKDYQDYFIFMLLTGLRRDEASSLKWDDVKFKQNLLIARDTKNRRDHVLPLTDYLYAFLKQREALKTNDYVFPGNGNAGHIVDSRGYQQQVKVKFTPHALRRTFSYAAARVRLGESERKALLNHMNQSNVTDLHYTPWAVDHLREPLKLVQDFILKGAGQVVEFKQELLAK